MKQQTRLCTIEKRNDGGGEIYTASLSSELPVKRGGYIEVLEHSQDAINMERATDGLVLLFNHDIDKPIGRVSDIGLRKDNKLTGNFTFSDDADGKRMKSMVDEGTLKDISIRYSIDKEERDENERGEITYTAKRWTPMEASIVTVPADHTVGIGRSEILPTKADKLREAIDQLSRTITEKEGKTMSKEATPNGEQGNAGNGVVNFDSARKAGQNEGVVLERQRMQEIESLFSEQRFQSDTYQALKRSLLADGSTVEQATRKLLSHYGNDNDAGYEQPNQRTEQRQAVRVTEAGEDKVLEGIRNAVDVKFHMGDKEELAEKAKANPYAGARLVDIARECLRLQGVENPLRWNDYDAVGYALQPRALPYSEARSLTGHGTSVFANLTENIANKQVQIGFSEAQESWRQFCRVGSVSSFRQESRVDTSAFTSLDEVPENGEYEHGTMSDRKEYIQAKKYGKLFAITREVIVNDDMDALMRIPQLMGRAAERKTGDLVYAILTNGTSTSAPYVMADGAALFNASRTSGTNIATTTGAPSVSTLDNMNTLMALMKDHDGNAIGSGLEISYVIVPRALKTTAQILATATNDPISNAATSGDANTGGVKPNPFANTFQVISDARLDASSSSVWYAAANQSLVDTIEVAYLNGQQSPSLESENGFTVDGITYKVRLEVAAKALGWYGLQRNAG